MQWEEFSAVALAIIYYVALWCLIAVPAILVLLAIGRFFPTSPREVAVRIWAFAPAKSQATSRFLDAISNARDKLSLGTIRILLDRKHAALKTELEKIRRVLDRHLKGLVKNTSTGHSASLVDLIADFQSSRKEALELADIEHDLPDQLVAHSRAKAVFGFMLFFMLVFIAINFGLLYLFFSESLDGQTIPYLGIQVAFVAALIFPLVEAAGGVGSELALEKTDGPGTRIILILGIGFVIFALASLEFFIFYQLFAGGFSMVADFERGGVVHYSVASVGPALTIIEGIFGFALARNFLRLKEFAATRSLKKEFEKQRAFVDDLEARFDRIDEASDRAGKSLEDLSAQLIGRGEAMASISSDLGEQRQNFLDAMDSVNPRKWQDFANPSSGDVEAVTNFAWFIPIILTLVAAIFAYVFHESLLESELIADRWLAISLGVLVPFVALLSGGWFFERATAAVDLGGEWKDVLSPRDGAFKVSAVVALSLMIFSTLWICTAADGLLGSALGLMLSAFLFGLAWAGSYMDLALRGLTFLGAIIWHTVVWLLRAIIHLAHQILLLLGAALSAVGLLLLQVLAYPATVASTLLLPTTAASKQGASA